MRINELLVEFELPDALKNTRIANVFGKDVTAGDVANVVPGVDANTVIKGAKGAYNVATTKLFDVPGYGPYTVGDAIIDGALVAADVMTVGAVTPAIAARWGTKIGAKELENFAARKAAIAQTDKAVAKKVTTRQGAKEVGKDVARNIDVLPDMGQKSTTLPDQPKLPDPKKKRRKVGEVIPVKNANGKYNLPIVKVLPDNGYVVDASKVPGQKPGATMNAPEPDVL